MQHPSIPRPYPIHPATAVRILLGCVLVMTGLPVRAQEAAPANPPVFAPGPPPGEQPEAVPASPPMRATPMAGENPEMEGLEDLEEKMVPPPPVELPSSGMAPGAMDPTVPAGPSVSDLQLRSNEIEDTRPERVPVYPDDPDSAWWEINPHYAFTKARREQRPLLLLFTGVWNQQALALSQEVFSTKSFNDYAKENLVICYLAYEQNHTDNSDALRFIKDKYRVRGFPNVLIFNPNGEVEKGIAGYRSGRPVDYFNQLKATCLPVLLAVEEQKKQMTRLGYRDWRNYLGREIFARFVAHDMVHVILEDATNVRWTIKLNDLSPDDQKLVESFPRVDIVGPPRNP